MDQVSNMFRRAHWQQITGFIRFGAPVQEDDRPLDERIAVAEARIGELVAEAVPDQKKQNELLSKIYLHCAECEEAHLEIGLLMGLRLGERWKETDIRAEGGSAV